MGTRNLTMVKLGDKLFGQYGQWDGYPEGQGAVALAFLKTFDERRFHEQFQKATFLSNEDLERFENEAVEATPPSMRSKFPGFVSMETAAIFKERHFHLERSCGAKILKYIQDLDGVPQLSNDIAFAGDSLFCEWGYMVDLDSRTLRCFRGFNEKPLEDGQFFKDLPGLKLKKQGKYEPIREIHSFGFDELKNLSEADFVSTLTKIAYPEET